MKNKPIPRLAELPERYLMTSLQELYSLSPGNTQAERNYAIIRMVTTIEDVLKELSTRVKEVDKYPQKIEIDRDTLRNVLQEPETAEYTHKRILAETLSFQNIREAQSFKDKHAKDVRMPKSLDGLFIERHNLVHSVTNTKLNKDDIEGIRGELFEFLLAVSCQCIDSMPDFMMGCVVMKAGKDPTEYFEKVLKKRPLHTKIDSRVVLQVGFAHQTLGQFKEAAEVYSECIKQSKGDVARYYKLKSEQFYYMGEDETAFEILQEGLKKYPKDLGILFAYCSLGSSLQKNVASSVIELLAHGDVWPDSRLKGDVFLYLSVMLPQMSAEDPVVVHDVAGLCLEKHKQLEKLIKQ